MLCELDCLSEQELQNKLKLLSRETADVKAKRDKLSEKGKQVEEPSEPNSPPRMLVWVPCLLSVPEVQIWEASNLGGGKYSKRRGTAFGSSLSATHAVRA